MDVNIEGGWKEALSAEFEKEYFKQLAERVRVEYKQSGCRIYPAASRIFAAFDATPFDKTRVVIIGQDPYHGEGQAHGLSFSVPKGVILPPSLRNIFKEICDETGSAMPEDGDLTRWAEQGVLLLNSTLTVREHQPKSHGNIGWEQFTDAVVDILNHKGRNLVFILWGADAIRKGRYIDRGRHLVLTSPHPSPLSAHRGFFGNRHFVMANEYLRLHGFDEIKW